MTAATVGVALSDVYGSFTRMVQNLDFTTIRRAQSIGSTQGPANIFRLLTVSLSELMLTLEKTRYLSVSQTYGLCLALLDRSIWAGIFYGTVTSDLLLWGTTHFWRIAKISVGK